MDFRLVMNIRTKNRQVSKGTCRFLSFVRNIYQPSEAVKSSGRLLSLKTGRLHSIKTGCDTMELIKYGEIAILSVGALAVLICAVRTHKPIKALFINFLAGAAVHRLGFRPDSYGHRLLYDSFRGDPPPDLRRSRCGLAVDGMHPFSGERCTAFLHGHCRHLSFQDIS